MPIRKNALPMLPFHPLSLTALNISLLHFAPIPHSPYGTPSSAFFSPFHQSFLFPSKNKNATREKENKCIPTSPNYRLSRREKKPINTSL